MKFSNRTTGSGMRIIYRLVLPLLVLIALPALAQQPSADDDPNLPPHFVQVNAGIYRGGRPSTDDLKSLAQMGIKTIINLQGGDLINERYRSLVKVLEPGESSEAISSERELALANGLSFTNTPLDSLDPVTDDEDAAIAQTLERLDHASAKHPVFIHCEHGQDRTGLVIALYRIEHDKWTSHQANEEWQSYGHNVLHQLFTDDLDTYFATKTASAKVF